MAPHRQGETVKRQEMIESLPHVLAEPVIDLSLVKGHFDRGTYMLLLHRIKELKEDIDYHAVPCGFCAKMLYQHRKAIQCDQ